MTAEIPSQDDSPIERHAAARPWPLALGLALAAVYLPQLVPLVATDLPRDAHCVGTYARNFVVLAGLGPGVWARIATDLGEPWEEVVCLAVATAVVLGLVICAALALRRWRRLGVAAALAVALLSAALSMFAAAIIRA